MIIRLKDSVYLKDHDEHTVFAIDVNSSNDEILKFQDTAAFVMHLIQSPTSLTTIQQQILEQFEVSDPSLVEADLQNLIQHLLQVGYIEVVNATPGAEDPA